MTVKTTLSFTGRHHRFLTDKVGQGVFASQSAAVAAALEQMMRDEKERDLALGAMAEEVRARVVNGLFIAMMHLTLLRHSFGWQAIVKVISVRYQLAMISEPQTPDRIAELLVHLGRAVRSEDARSELTAAQWTCLRFFARANGSTRTPSAFASFQATTRGTASQIIKSLERRGLVSRTRSERDRRSVCFDLTDTGRAMLECDPLGVLVELIDGLDETEGAQFLTTLSGLASALAAKRDVPSFGTCRDCTHFGTTGDAAYCACLAAELATDEIDRLCASYTPRLGNTSEGDRDGANRGH